MSAFTVQATHIDVLITGALDLDVCWVDSMGRTANLGPGRTSNATQVGQMLLNENYASVNHRYQETGRPPTYTFAALGGRVDPIVVAHAIKRLVYNSDQHPGWEASEANRFLTALLIRCAGSMEQTVEGMQATHAYTSCRTRGEVGDRDIFEEASRI